MKKLYALLLASSLAIPSLAQTQKGQSITSGSVNLSLNRTLTSFDDSKYTSYSAGLQLNRGVFVKDNWLLGYSVGANYQRTDSKTATQLTTFIGEGMDLSAGLILRRYWPVLDRLFVYAGGGLGAGRQAYNNQSFYNNLYSTSGLNWQLTAVGQVGALYTLSNRIAVEASISNSFPTALSNASFGVAILTGNGNQSQPADGGFDAPQTRAGRWLLGALANVSSTRQSSSGTEQNQKVATAGISVGRFIKNNLLLGIALDYSANRPQSGNEYVEYSPSAQAFVRSYMGTSRLRPFIQGSVGYGFNKTSDSPVYQRNVRAGISAGLAYMAGDRFIIQTTLGSLAGQYFWALDTVLDPGYSYYNVQATATTLSNISVAYSL
ncbi:outer membrane beta-barrel protein [Fibrella forsythiae]|uniref:Outer membrane protein beta-barrel domain-containing protein n=1 Tax=Fibrella forsythiae TaxID=2817061 RepID=A0ABS3JRW3_9BACT|nr:outer membrane beta-barrel protein [Fibrella forsythiae]MBO0952718.1 hypothetical protein [Fibrella forsythiae]